MIKPVILWTDALVFVLVAVILAFIGFARHREYLRVPWRRVARSPLGMGALMVLLVYVAIGLLDSVHFRLRLENRGGSEQAFYSSETLSLLDVLLTPMRTRVEKTYSAPFATHAYTKEAVELPHGETVRTYPRLLYGGAHLEDLQERGADITLRSLAALAYGLIIWGALIALWTVGRGLSSGQTFREVAGDLLSGRMELPWRSMWLTAGTLVLLMSLVIELSPYYHLLGTDKVGQDVLYQAVKSIRTGLVIGTLTTLIMLPFALLLGTLAGYLGGWVDDVIQYLYTTLNSIPAVLLIAAAVLMLQVYMDNRPELFETVAVRADMRLLFLCIILGVTSWTTLSRLLRGESLKLRETDYVQASIALGARRSRILVRHILPNVMHIVLITVVLDFSGLVLAEAVLSYVGVGVDPSMLSWGNMINSARLELARDPVVWWTLAAAFALMFGLVLSANLFADAVRDAFDPRATTFKGTLVRT
jgi:peptide/nickel transport system permease protein